MSDKVILWGDSIGKGVIYHPNRKRYCLARERCTALLREAGLDIENNARMGATIREGYSDFCQSPADAGDIVVIEYGGNDCDLDWDAVAADPEVFHDGKTPLSEFRSTLTAFIQTVRQRDMKPLAVVPPPLEAGRFYRWVSRGRDAARILRYLVDVQHIYRWQERYSNAVWEAAVRLNCRLADLRGWMLEELNYPSVICDDGIHPNEAGHELIARAAAGAFPLC